ncbi:MAG: serine/threonine protein kinase [Gemmatimonadota bacterium]|nr:serine/threonine protein kinase [Gemmatimonadota bacterium]
MAYPPLTGLFAERYVIERELGHGATAVVYLARDNKHNRDIALKVLSKDLAHALGPERFLREIQFTTRLHHPHILPIFDSGEWNGMLYYVLPYVRGESLRQKIDRETQLPIEECVRIACEVADALAHAHSQGIVHRDVKPENIMLSDGHALLADFGIARTLDVHTGERLTSSGLIVGTSAYMSPEQAAGEEKIDARSDIYSLACVLYEMIAGVQAFTGPTTQSVIAQRFKHTPRPVSTYRPQVPEYLENALGKALSISPADRYSTIKKFAAELPDAPTAGRDRRRSPIRRFIHGRQKAFGFAAAALVVLTAAMVAVNPPGSWRSPFARHAQLDSARYIVVPSPSPGHSDIGAKDVDAVARLARAMQKWNGLALVDPQVVSEAIASNRLAQTGDAFELAMKNHAGRLIRVNAAGDASLSDVATGSVINDISIDDVKGASDLPSATALKLLSAKDRPKSADGGDGRTSSFIAWQAYGRAHSALAKHDFAAARAEFAAAVAADDSYPPARLWFAQLSEWLQVGTTAWKNDALRAAVGAESLSPRDRLTAVALGALARDSFPEACALYRKMIASDSSDYVSWMGLGECQRLDKIVVASRASPSGFAFRSSFSGAYGAYARTVEIDPGLFDLVGFERLRKIKIIEANTGRSGSDRSKNSYGAYPTLDHDTVAYIPFPLKAMAALPTTILAKRRAALDRNLSDLLQFTRSWVGARPSSPQAHEALATVLEARGEIDEKNGRGLSASAALSRAIQLSTSPGERVRMRASEFRLRLKRGEFASARILSDSLMGEAADTTRAILDELIGVAAATGRIATASRLLAGSGYIPPEVNGVRLQQQVSLAAAAFLARAALGDCSGGSVRARAELERVIASYYTEKEATVVRASLEPRPISLMAPCRMELPGATAQGGSGDQLQRLQQAYARGNIALVKAILDSTEVRHRTLRPGDVSLDYTYQEAWLRAAIGDTSGAIKQLDATLGALPSLGRGTLREPGGAAALARAMALRAEIAASRHDAPTAARYGRAVSDLWEHADPELGPMVGRMKLLAAAGR